LNLQSICLPSFSYVMSTTYHKTVQYNIYVEILHQWRNRIQFIYIFFLMMQTCQPFNSLFE
jgi:hypothetical protein